MKLMAFSCFPWVNYRPEKAMAPHSSTLAWKIPWTEELGRLQSMGSRRVGHDWVTSLSLFTLIHWRRKWQPTPVFLPGESQGRGSLWAAVYGVTQCRTWLKWLSSSSSSNYKHSRDYVQTIRIVLTFLQNFFHYNMKNYCVLCLQILFLRLIIEKGFWY